MKIVQLVISMSLALILTNLASSANAADSLGEPISIDNVYDSPLLGCVDHSPWPYPSTYLAYLQKLFEYKASIMGNAPKTAETVAFKLQYAPEIYERRPLTYSKLQQIEFSSDRATNDFYKKMIMESFPVKRPPDSRYACAGFVITIIYGNITVDMSKEFPRPVKSPTGLPILSKPFLLKTH